MSRPNRLHIEGGVYHVFNRLARGARGFSDDTEAGLFLKILGEVKERDGLRVVDIARAIRKSPDGISKAVARASRRR